MIKIRRPAMKVLFRLDDICPMMKHDSFMRIKNLFMKYGIEPIIGVVPDCKDSQLNIDVYDEQFWIMMKDLQQLGWTIAMHGYQHLYLTNERGLVGSADRSEFAGLPYETQKEMINNGREILLSHGIDTDVFMAPSHSYDSNTLKCLEECGFKYVTDGLTRFVYRRGKLIFVPCLECRIRKVIGVSTVCYHTNSISEKRIRELESFASKASGSIFSFEEVVNDNIVEYSFCLHVVELLYSFFKYTIICKIWRIVSTLKNKIFK